MCNNSNLAQSGSISHPRRYHIPKRLQAQKQIRHLLINEALSNQAISERLKIPKRTVDRYISDMYRHDNELLAKVNDDEKILTDMNIARERLAAHKQEMLKEIRSDIYKDASLKEKVEYWHLICELEACDMKFSQEAPQILARHHSLPGNDRLLLPRLMSTHLEEEKEERR